MRSKRIIAIGALLAAASLAYALRSVAIGEQARPWYETPECTATYRSPDGRRQVFHPGVVNLHPDRYTFLADRGGGFVVLPRESTTIENCPIL